MPVHVCVCVCVCVCVRACVPSVPCPISAVPLSSQLNSRKNAGYGRLVCAPVPPPCVRVCHPHVCMCHRHVCVCATAMCACVTPMCACATPMCGPVAGLAPSWCGRVSAMSQTSPSSSTLRLRCATGRCPWWRASTLSSPIRSSSRPSRTSCQ